MTLICHTVVSLAVLDVLSLVPPITDSPTSIWLTNLSSIYKNLWKLISVARNGFEWRCTGVIYPRVKFEGIERQLGRAVLDLV